MTEPTIICPNCQTEIRLTESLAAPLIAATRQQYEQRLAQQAAEIKQREQHLSEREAQTEAASRNLQAQVAEQVATQLQTERAQLMQAASQQAKLAVAAELQHQARELADLQEVLKSRDEKLAEAQNAQAELLKKQRELDDAKRELELTVEKRVQTSLAEVRGSARKEAEEGLKLKVMEKDQTIASMQQKIEELKQKAEQGSQQLQGEVQELELENLLRIKFPYDQIEPVPKGEFGGDALQRVFSPSGQASGTLLWETKRTKNWSDTWLTRTATSALAARWSSRNLVSQLSLQFLVRLVSHRMVPLASPLGLNTRCSASPPNSPLGTGSIWS